MLIRICKILFLGLVIAVIPTVSSAAVVIKIATLAPEGTTWMREMRAGAEAVKSKTEGRVEFKYYPGGVMGADAAVLRKIKLGQLQGAAFTSSDASNITKNANIYSLPFLFRNDEEVQHIRSAFDQRLRDEFDKNGYVALGLSGGGFAYLYSAQEIKNKPDLQSRKVWTPISDKIALVAFETSGVSPTPLSLADVYTGLQTGLVDTVGNTHSGIIAFQWHTKLKHSVDLPLTYVAGMLLVDKRSFAKVSPADQAIVRAEIGKAFTNIDSASASDNASAKKALLGQGIAYFTPDANEVLQWQQVGVDARMRLVSEGTLDASWVNDIEAALKKFRADKAAAK